MRALIIDENSSRKIKQVIEYAKKHPHNVEIIRKRMTGDYPVPIDYEGFTCVIPMDFKCVYTIEEHPHGWSHHLSVSVPEPTKLPNIEAVKMLMREFEMTTPIKECHVWLEDCEFNRAVNVLCKMTRMPMNLNPNFNHETQTLEF